MPKPTIIYYTVLKYRPENIKRLKECFKILELPSPAHDYPEALAAADVILAPLGFCCGKEKIDAAPALKVIGSNTTGHPHIDVNYASEKGIKVVTLKEQRDFLKTITPTAELTWGLIIALTRNIAPASRSVLQGNWDRRLFGGKCMLSRMRLGIAGLGRLGSMVAKYGRAFGMQVGYYDPFINVTDKDLTRADTLEDLVSASDIVTIHIPHEPQTENLFNRELFNNFKEGSYLINTSRAEIVDHEALLECLQNKKLAGAAMDVFMDEFIPGFNIRKYPLYEYARTNDNLLLTPHIGGSTVDAWQMTEELTIKMIIDALNGEYEKT